jgi:hypothetical protein
MSHAAIRLHHAHATSGGNGPGTVTVPFGEAQVLVDAGYAVFLPAEPEPEPEPAPARASAVTKPETPARPVTRKGLKP